MKIGLGLPNAVPDLERGRFFVEAARRAEKLGFSSLATIGRIAYPSYEELVTLSAAAGATERLGLFTNVLLGPARDALLLAKQAATLDQVSGGRFVLGVGVGSREDDFTVAGLDFHTRGRRWDQSLDLIHRAWSGSALPGSERTVGPRPVNGSSVPMLFGGGAPQSMTRLVKYGRGYTQGGGTPEGLAEMRLKVTAAWGEAKRKGTPEFRALTYFVLGDQNEQALAEHNLRDYYGPWGDRVWAGAARDADAVRERVEAYQAAGCDELYFCMTAPSITQAERVAELTLA